MAFDGIGFRGIGGAGTNRLNLSIKSSVTPGSSPTNSAASNSNIQNDQGRRAVGRGVENLNSLISSVNLTSEKLGQLASLTDGLINLANTASRGATSDETRAELDRNFQRISTDFSKITDNTELNGVDLLSKDGLSKLFEAVGISTENSQPIADIFSKIAKGASEEGQLASTRPHRRRRQIPTQQVDSTTTSVTSELVTATPTGGAGEVVAIDTADAAPVSQFTGSGTLQTSSNGTSADGRYTVFYDSGSGSLYVQDSVADTQSELAVLTAGVYDPSNLSISADGNFIAFTSAEDLTGQNAGNYQQLYTINRTTLDQLQLTQTADNGEEIRGIAINSDGTHVAFTSHTTYDSTGVRTGFDAVSYELNIVDNTTDHLYSTSDKFTLVDATNDLAVLQFGNIDGTSVEYLYGAARTNIVDNASQHTQIFSFTSDGSGGLTNASLGLSGTGDQAVTQIRVARPSGNATDDVYFSTTKDFSVSGQDSNNSTNESQIYKYVKDTGVLVQLTNNTEDFAIETFSVSTDGKSVDFLTTANLTGNNSSNYQQVYRYHQDIGVSQLTAFTSSQNLGTGQLSASSESLVYADTTRLKELDYSLADITIDGSDVTVQLGYNKNLAPVASGDGQYVFFANKDSNKIQYINTTTGAITDVGTLTGGDTTSFQTIEVSGDGNTAAIVGNLGSGYGLYVYDRGDASLTKVNTTNSSYIASVAISADGSTVAYANNFENKIYSYDVSSNTKTDLTLSKASLSNFVNSQFSLSSDGNYVLVESSSNPLGTNANGNSELFLYNTSENTLRQVTNTSGAALNGNTSVVTDFGDVFFFADADLDSNGNTHSQIFKYSYSNQSTDQLTSYLSDFGGDTTGTSGDLRLTSDGNSLLFLSSSNPTTGVSYGGNAVEALKYDFVSGTTTKLTNNATNQTELNTGNAPQLTDAYLLFVDAAGAIGQGENRIFQQAYSTSAASDYTQGGTTSYLYATTEVRSENYSTRSSLLGSGSISSRGQAVYTLENLKDLKQELEKNIAAVDEARQVIVDSVDALKQESNGDRVAAASDNSAIAKSLADQIKRAGKDALDAHSLEAVLVKALTAE